MAKPAFSLPHHHRCDFCTRSVNWVEEKGLESSFDSLALGHILFSGQILPESMIFSNLQEFRNMQGPGFGVTLTMTMTALIHSYPNFLSFRLSGEGVGPVNICK